MHRHRRIAVVVVVLALSLALGVTATHVRSQPSAPGAQTGNRAIRHALAATTDADPEKVRARQVSSAMLEAGLTATGGGVTTAALGPPPLAVRPRSNGCATRYEGRPTANIRVNQDCSLRRNSEPWIAINPTDPNNYIAGMNDNRIGFNQTALAYSLDRGQTWGDFTVPFAGFIGRGGHSFDAASDPAIAFDSRGNAYYAAILFDLNTPQSALLVTKSNKEFKGSLFHSPNANAAPGPFSQPFRTDPPGIVANDNDPAIAHDKEFISADQNPTSPKRDYVYVTWTRFNFACGVSGADYCESPIYFSQSRDGGASWSTGIEINGKNAAICGFADFFNPSLDPAKCNFSQGSYPVVSPNGDIHVIFNNGNSLNPDNFSGGQQLHVMCPVTKDCAVAANWSAPVEVAEDYNLQPYSCPQAPGRQCLPPNSFRMNDYPSMAVDKLTGDLYVAWADFRNGGPCAGPPTALPAMPCANLNNDVFLSRSTNNGVTWSAPVKVNQDAGEAAQVFPWIAVAGNGIVYVGYYDRRYGCETFGCVDFSLSMSHDGGRTWLDQRITTRSMTGPETSVNQGGFLGDYNSLAANDQNVVMVWTDTRGLYGQNEQDIYFASLAVPRRAVSGRGACTGRGCPPVAASVEEYSLPDR